MGCLPFIFIAFIIGGIVWVLSLISNSISRNQRFNPVALRAAIEKNLAPGEEIIDAGYFDEYVEVVEGGNTTTKYSNTYVLVITNKYFRSFIFSGKKLNVTAESHSLLEDCSQISSSSNIYAINFKIYINGVAHSYENTNEIESATRFVENLKKAVDFKRDQLSSGGTGNELKELSKLLEKGLLTDEEWSRAKALFLGKPRDKQEESIKLLYNLYELHKAGALSFGEFNQKKWDLLSKK